MTEKYVNLDAEPIVQTPLEEIEADLRTHVQVGDQQAQEHIQRLSERVRFLVDELRKEQASNRALTRDRGELAAQVLHLNREIDAYTEELVDARRPRLSEPFVPTPEVFKIEESALKEESFSYIPLYFRISQEFSNFHGDTTRLRGSTEHLSNACVALAEETWEVDEIMRSDQSTGTALAALKEELGDVCWCLAMLCDATGHSMEALAKLAQDKRCEATGRSIESCTNEMRGHGMSLLSHSKKVHFHGHPIDHTLIWSHAVIIFANIYDFCSIVGWDIREVLNENLEKNKKRYPSGKFVSEDSVRRADV